MHTPVPTSEGTQTYEWKWSNQTLNIAYDRRGEGSPVLLLPAFSTVSSRKEWETVAQILSAACEVTCVDWPGFGESDKAAIAYNAVLYEAFLPDFATACFDRPLTVVAAGHAAGYALQLAQRLPKQVARLVLVAPTWRGPLPTMGASEAIARSVETLVRTPWVGQLLYYLNTRPSFLKWMYGRHVFADAQKLTPDFIAAKYATTQQRGARFGPAAFVTGGLDPVTNRGAFLQLFSGLRARCLVVIGADSPPKSKAEMEAIAAIASAQIQSHPGSLGLHEEYGAEVAALIQTFLQQESRSSALGDR
ncbi:alpha/beta fold hydrolase [Altericista sp. CCNU0014]|uniref:alpha/beta fold hydrolase n=1 Tax=Altericista sp. CCNU0014 TaxID=3082949 RepID=UPI00384D4851